MRHGTNNPNQNQNLNQNQNNNNRRPRGRTHQHGNNKRPQHNNGGNRNQNYDSNGPQGRIRGTAKQIFEKYTQMAKDAISSGDRVLVESLFQFADHYGRIAALSEPKPRQDYDQNSSGDNADVDGNNASSMTEGASEAKVVEITEAVESSSEAQNELFSVADEEKPRRRTPRAAPPRAARKRLEENTPKLGGGTSDVPDFLARPVKVSSAPDKEVDIAPVVVETTDSPAVVDEKPKRTRRVAAVKKDPAKPRAPRRKKTDDAPVAEKADTES